MTFPTDLRSIHLLPVAAQMVGRRTPMYRSTRKEFPPYIRLFKNGEPMWSLSAVQEFLAETGEQHQAKVDVLASYEALIHDINAGDGVAS